jgi:hypothetical protein
MKYSQKQLMFLVGAIILPLVIAIIAFTYSYATSYFQFAAIVWFFFAAAAYLQDDSMTRPIVLAYTLPLLAFSVASLFWDLTTGWLLVIGCIWATFTFAITLNATDNVKSTILSLIVPLLLFIPIAVWLSYEVCMIIAVVVWIAVVIAIFGALID